MKTTKTLATLAALGLLLTHANAQSFLTNGLVAYYPFNGNANDVTGTNNGVVSNAFLAVDRFGNQNRAFSFNGTNSYIRVTKQITTNRPFAWSVWLRPNFSQTNVPAVLLCEGLSPGGGTASPALAMNWGATPASNAAGVGRFQFYTYNSPGYFLESQQRPQYNTNQWYQLVATLDSSGNGCLYVNGVLEGTIAGMPFGQNNGNFYIGGSVSQGQTYFSGSIDDVRIYNRALSTNEVAQLYSIESYGPPNLGISTYNNSPVVFFPTATGTNYTLRMATNLAAPTWVTVTNGVPFSGVQITNAPSNAFFQLQ